MKTPNQPKDMKIKQSQITIERVIFNANGQLTALDVHDESNGEAVFLEVKGRHFHGYYKPLPKIKK